MKHNLTLEDNSIAGFRIKETVYKKNHGTISAGLRVLPFVFWSEQASSSQDLPVAGELNTPR